MGYLLIAITIGLVLWIFISLVGHTMARGSSQEVESVDIIEGGSIVEQQRYGRERWRQVEVEIPSRSLSYEEQLNLRSILESGNENVRITTPPLDLDDQEGRRLREERTHDVSRT